MEISLKRVNPYVRFASVVEKNKDYSDFLYAYDYRLFNKSIDMKQSDLLIFPPDTAYKIKYRNSKTAKYIILNFDFDYAASDKVAIPPSPLNTFDKNKIMSKTYYPPFNEIFLLENSAEIEDDIKKVIAETENQDKYSKECASAVMKQLLIKTLRLSCQKRNNPAQKLCIEIKNYIKLNFSDKLTNIAVAEKFGYHPYYLNSVFVKCTGMTHHDFITHIRLDKAKTELLNTNSPISEIAEKCGFASQSYFSECFKAVFGKRPTEYRKQGW